MGGIVAKPRESGNHEIVIKRRRGLLQNLGFRVKDDDEDEFEEKKEDEQELKKKELFGYVDPAMPVIGQPVKFEQLHERNVYVRNALRKLLLIVTEDAVVSNFEGTKVPIQNGLERVVVTQEIMDLMDVRHTKRHLKEFTLKNLNEIQRALTFRRTAVKLMNINYSKVLVREIEPVNLNETRSIVERRKVDRQDVPTNPFERRREVVVTTDNKDEKKNGGTET